MKKLIIIFGLLCSSIGFSQENENVLTLEEYLGFVKMYHPVVKQAQLITNESEAKLLKSRGAFDPKLEVDYARKKFKGTEYYDKLNAAFKIPTWYGVEFKANYEKNSGTYLNPEYNTPEDGLYSLGVSVSLAKNLLINGRLATLKQAKLFNQQALMNQELLVNDILYQTIVTYFNWLKNYQAELVYENYVLNAQTRLKIVKSSFNSGDKPAIDTVEASINLKNRLVDYEKAKVGRLKSKLELSNFLWLEGNIPLELEENVIPDTNTIFLIDQVLNNSILNFDDEFIANHPKIQSLNLKKESLEVDKNLKVNNLLPQIDFQYNFLTTEYDDFDALTSSNYKSGVNVSFPLFLRKERGDLKLAKLKLQDIDYEISAAEVVLKNKITSTLAEIESYSTQYQLLLKLQSDHAQMVKSEERKFALGESSIFLVNYREVKFIENQLKTINTEFELFNSKSNLLKVITNLD